MQNFSKLLTLLCLLIPSLLVASVVHAQADNNNDVALIGLGKMGMALAKCWNDSTDQIQVHAWNRGKDKRKALADKNLANVIVYDTLEETVSKAKYVITCIDNWQGSIEMLQGSFQTNPDVWKGKTIALYSTYSPLDIFNFEKQIETDQSLSDVTLLGGAIVGVPETICSGPGAGSRQAIILASSKSVQKDDKFMELVGHLGHSISFGGNVGLASLVNMAIIQTITFGIAGYELALLLLKTYLKDTQTMLPNFQELASKVGPVYTQMLIQQIKPYDFQKTYVPAAVFLGTLQMQEKFMKDIGIASPTFLSTYIESLLQIKNPKKEGPAAWIHHVKTEKIIEAKDEL